MLEPRKCLICKQEFLPSKYRKDQQICSRPECQHQRQLRNLLAWRQKNPGYFRTSRHESSWAKLYRERARKWRKRNKDRIKRYKEKHKEEHRTYMRQYMFRLRHPLAFWLITSALLCCTWRSCWPQTVLAAVNGRSITLEEFNARIQAYNTEIEETPEIPNDLKAEYLIQTEEAKQWLLEGMLERELIVAEALKRGLDQDTGVLKTLEALKEQVLFNRMLELEREKAQVGMGEVEDYYNAHQEEFTVPEERRVSVIVLADEEKAKEVLILLLQGADFAACVRESSIDQSASSGGDIGFIARKGAFAEGEKKTMFSQFEETAFALEPHTPSTIFKGPHGYYIIKVTEIKELYQRPLSQVYRQIEQMLLAKKQQDSLENLLSRLRQGADIVVNEELLKD